MGFWICIIFEFMRGDQAENRGRRAPQHRNFRSDNKKGGDNRPRRTDNQDQPDRTFKKHFIKRDQEGKPRNTRRIADKGANKGRDKKKGDDRDLDR